MTRPPGRAAQAELQHELAAALREVPADGLALGVTSGLGTAVAYRGSVAGRPVGPDTVFYGASLTKQVVAALLARLVLAGGAAVDDSIRRWLPDLPAWTARVRLRHLLHHTSDLPEVTRPQPRVPADNQEVLDRLRDLRSPRRFLPGARFCYRNTGYVLLAEAVTRISGQPVDRLAAETFFGPLGLTATRLGGAPVPLPAAPDPPGTIGDGGLWTSVSDLTRWLDALNRGTVGPAVVRLLETPGRLDDETPLDYAWGVRVVPTPAGRRVSHGGSWAPWLAKTVRIPDRQVAVALLSTGSDEDTISAAGLHLAARFASR